MTQVLRHRKARNSGTRFRIDRRDSLGGPRPAGTKTGSRRTDRAYRISLGFAALQGQPVTSANWLAVLAIVAGISIVAASTRDDAPDGYASSTGVALMSCRICGRVCLDFAVAQEALRQGTELPVILIGRIVTQAVFLALLVIHRTAADPLRPSSPVLALNDGLILSPSDSSLRLPRCLGPSMRRIHRRFSAS